MGTLINQPIQRQHMVQVAQISDVLAELKTIKP